MNLWLELRNIFFISLLLLNISKAQVAIKVFVNKSNYEGNWNLSYQIPDFISDYLRERFGLIVLSPYLIEREWLNNQDYYSNLSEFLSSRNIRFLIDGRIREFSIIRLTAGEPKFAQYETYSNEIGIEIEVSDLTNKQIVLLETLEQKSSDLEIGMTIFGRESDTKREFYRLNQIEFGSSEFMTTLVGKNLLKFCEKLSIKLEPLLLSLSQDLNSKENQTFVNETSKFKKRVLSGEILFVDEDTKEVFINLGKKENLEVGSYLSVYAPRDTLRDSDSGEILGIVDKKIGEIEILEVRGERFSLGIIKEENEKILKGHKVRIYELIPR